MHQRDVELKATENKGTRGVLQTPEGVLPYMTYTGMCLCTEYGFRPLCTKQDDCIILPESVLNRVYNFAQVCPKQGNKIEGFVLSRVCSFISNFFPKQGQGFKPGMAHLYPNVGRVPPPPPRASNPALLGKR